jgi:hypothetical protein
MEDNTKMSNKKFLIMYKPKIEAEMKVEIICNKPYQQTESIWGVGGEPRD